MLTINFYNDGTGDKITGNYDYEVLVNSRVIAEGRVENHARGEGWQALIAMLLSKEVFKQHPEICAECHRWREYDNK